MIRWLRITAIWGVIIAFITLGVGVGLFLVANDTWVPLKVPSRLTDIFGDRTMEMWLPGLFGGWLVAVFGAVAAVLWSMWYVWRRRQYESLIARLERELARLRNLPFTDPAPLEDLPEVPDPRAAEVLAQTAGAEDTGMLGDPSTADGAPFWGPGGGEA